MVIEIMVAVLLGLSVVYVSLLAWLIARHKSAVHAQRLETVELARTVDFMRTALSAHVDAASVDMRRELSAGLASKTKVDAHAQHEKAADMGIALAERMARLHPVGPRGEKMLTSSDKVKMAVDWAVEYCSDVEAPISPAEMRKVVEIRLEQVQPKKKKG